MHKAIILAACEGILFGISMFFFMLDKNGGPDGLYSKELYKREYKNVSIAGGLDDTSVNEELINLANEYVDYVGYISVEGTSIHYPVMRDRTDATGYYYYLSHNYMGESDSSGCPFIRRSSDLSDDVLEVFAHNNRNGTMFADLMRFEDEDFFNDNGLIRFDTVDGCRTYKVISVLDVAVDGGEYTFFGWSNFPDEQTETEFLRQITEYGVVKTHEPVSPGNQYLLLVTCEYTHVDGRRIVVAIRTS